MYTRDNMHWKNHHKLHSQGYFWSFEHQSGLGVVYQHTSDNKICLIPYNEWFKRAEFFIRKEFGYSNYFYEFKLGLCYLRALLAYRT